MGPGGGGPHGGPLAQKSIELLGLKRQQHKIGPQGRAGIKPHGDAKPLGQLLCRGGTGHTGPQLGGGELTEL